MRFLILNIDAPPFTTNLYARNPGLAGRSYEEQLRVRYDSLFGLADFYSRNLRLLGHDAADIFANSVPLQRAWLREHGGKRRRENWEDAPSVRSIARRALSRAPRSLLLKREIAPRDFGILGAQIESFRPDVLVNLAVKEIPSSFLRSMRSHVKVMVGQIASPLGDDFSAYDLMISSLPNYVTLFRSRGLRAELLRLGFEHTVLDRLPSRAIEHQVVHIGGYGPIHRERNQILEAMLDAGVPLECWGYAPDKLPPGSPIRRAFRGDAWGIEMYAIRRNSRITVSKHISSVADRYANIMTLYEATGVGSMLLVDERVDIGELFVPGRQIVTYQNAEEAVRLAQYYLRHDEEREQIAAAGQRRTLQDHTYLRRMEQLIEILARHGP